MDRPSDQELLLEYAEHQSETAFAELVRRHIDLTHSAALRMVRDSHQAQDVTQAAFTALARNARQLTKHPVLSGWLHRTTQNLAANSVRTDVRRRAREKEAAAMHDLLSSDSAHSWDAIAPHLDAALGQLSETDRDALLLRYFEQKSAKFIAQTLGTSEDAAQKRVNRAVERLRGLLARRGVTVQSGALIALFGLNAVQPAPAMLAGTISAAAIVSAATAGTGWPALAQILATIPIKKALIGSLLVGTTGAGIFQAHQASTLRGQVQELQLQQNHLLEQQAQAQSERDLARARAVTAENALAALPPDARMTELMKLRGDVGALRHQVASLESELAKANSESIRGRFLPRDAWIDQGNGDPLATVETMLWAYHHEQSTRLEDVATPAALTETRWPIFPAEHPPIQSVGAVNLISSTQNQDNTRAVVTAFVREDFVAPPDGSTYSIDKLLGWRLEKDLTGWKISQTLFFDLGHE